MRTANKFNSFFNIMKCAERNKGRWTFDVPINFMSYCYHSSKPGSVQVTQLSEVILAYISE